MSRITNLSILQEYSGYGLYWCKFKGEDKLFTKNNNVFKVLTHFVDHDELNIINDDVRDELLQEIQMIKDIYE